MIKKHDETDYKAIIKAIDELNKRTRKRRDFLQSQVTDSQRLEALESAVADLMILSIKEKNL